MYRCTPCWACYVFLGLDTYPPDVRVHAQGSLRCQQRAHGYLHQRAAAWIDLYGLLQHFVWWATSGGSSGSQWSYKHLPMIPSFWEESMVAFAYGKSRVHVGPMWMIRVGEFHFQGFTIACGSWFLQVPPLPFASAAPRPSMRRQGKSWKGGLLWINVVNMQQCLSSVRTVRNFEGGLLFFGMTLIILEKILVNHLGTPFKLRNYILTYCGVMDAGSPWWIRQVWRLEKLTSVLYDAYMSMYNVQDMAYIIYVIYAYNII